MKIVPAVMIILSMIEISTSAFAETLNERTAKEMSIVLQSEEVTALLSQDGIGKFKEIKYLYTAPASWGPARYELSFDLLSKGERLTCTTWASLHTRLSKVVDLLPLECKPSVTTVE